jgi:myo-inositol-1(or 4)-monophosphatase
MSRQEDLDRIRSALEEAAQAVRPFTPGDVDFEIKNAQGDPLTAADEAADAVLRRILPRPGEGWLSEESADDLSRLECHRVWIVDPIDGTREFVQGIPEWCISIGLVEGGEPVAGGIYSPATDELVIGSLEGGVTYNGEPARVSDREGLGGALILASRSETGRGEWERFDGQGFTVRPCGSVAYKMALVAGGRIDGTWTVVPKNEWDVAAGAALVRAAGGVVTHLDGSDRAFNQEDPLMPNFLAVGEGMFEAVVEACTTPPFR